MTEEEEEQLSMFMRMVEFFRTHEQEVSTVPGLLEAGIEVKECVQKIFDLLSEEDHDRMLERYREDLIYMKLNTL